MPIATMILTLTGLMTVLTVLPSSTLGKEPSDSQSTVLLRRSLGEGEIVCTAGPNQAPALLRDLWDGEVVRNYLAVYEFHVDWQMRDNSPVRLWSTLFAVPKQQLANGRIQEIRPDTPEAKERVGVMDLAIVPARDETKGPLHNNTEEWPLFPSGCERY